MLNILTSLEVVAVLPALSCALIVIVCLKNSVSSQLYSKGALLSVDIGVVSSSI